ncbi:MAG: hypothetical protein IAG13_22725 [Deltaproteobacteria bacterium]|nr:hypothetical protein [Nannocystaceae bacterium]
MVPLVRPCHRSRAVVLALGLVACGPDGGKRSLEPWQVDVPELGQVDVLGSFVGASDSQIIVVGPSPTDDDVAIISRRHLEDAELGFIRNLTDDPSSTVRPVGMVLDAELEHFILAAYQPAEAAYPGWLTAYAVLSMDTLKWSAVDPLWPYAIALVPDGGLVVAGDLRVGDVEGSTTRVRRLAVDGAISWEVALEDNRVLALDVDGQGSAYAWTSFTDGHRLHKLGPDGARVWTTAFMDGELPAPGYRALAVRRDDVIVTTERNGAPLLRASADDGAAAFHASATSFVGDAGLAAVQALAVTADQELVVAGTAVLADGDPCCRRRAWAAVYDDALELQWEQRFDDGDNSSFVAVAVAPDDTIVALGVREDGTTARSWLTRMTR